MTTEIEQPINEQPLAIKFIHPDILTVMAGRFLGYED